MSITYNELQALYLGLFDRPADAGGETYWYNQSQGGTNVLTSLSSPSYAQYYSADNGLNGVAISPLNITGEIQNIYTNLLGYTPSATDTGVGYWVTLYTGGTSIGQILDSIYNIVENLPANSPYINEQTTMNTRISTANAFTQANAFNTYNNTTYLAEGQSITANQTTTTYVLTPKADIATANDFIGSLTPYLTDGVGPTLNYDDILTGASGSTNNTLTINDDYSKGTDLIPIGAQISNIQNIKLQTNGNAGNGAATPFSTANITGVTNLSVTSAGASTDYVQAASTTAINVTHDSVSGGVTTLGGDAVTVTDASSAGSPINIGNFNIANANPAGAVKVTSTGNTNMNIYGGTSVTVTDSGNGNIKIGDNAVTPFSSEPTGAVSVTDTGILSGTVDIYGGTTAYVTTTGNTAANADNIIIGSVLNNIVYAPSGNDTVIVNAGTPYMHNFTTGANAGASNSVNVIGGADVNVTTNDGGVTIGDNIFNGTTAIAGQNPSGTVTVNDTATGTGSGVGVTVYGGTDVTVNNAGGNVMIGSVNGNNIVIPSGTVTVNDTAAVLVDGILNTHGTNVTVLGGTDINVTTNAGSVTVGTNAAAAANPTGTVTVNDSSTDLFGNYVTVFGGTTVNVTSAGGSVTVGNGTAAYNPSGAVTVTESGIDTGKQYGSTVFVGGAGAGVTVNTTGSHSIQVGTNILTPGTPVTGPVIINDTFSGALVDNNSVTVFGGSTVNISETAASGAIAIGASPALNGTGTAISNIADDPTGNVTVNNSSTGVYGTGAADIFTNGSTTVSVTGIDTGKIEDAQVGVGGAAVGTSTLATVDLTGATGAIDIVSNALANLSIATSTAVTATVTDTTAKTALTVTLSGAVTAALNDANSTVTSVTLTTSGTAANDIILDLPVATALTFENGAAVTVDAGSTLTDLATVKATGAGSLTLGDLAALAHLTSIDASGASGNVSVEINPGETAFKGGSGVNTVTLDSTVAAAGLTYVPNGGSGADNTVILTNSAASFNPALHPNSPIYNLLSGFSILGFGDNGANTSGATGNYDVTGFSSETIGSLANGGAIDLINLPSVDSVTFTANPGKVVTLTATGQASETLNLTVGTATTNGVDMHLNAVSIVDATANAVTALTIDSVGSGLSGSLNELAVTDTSNTIQSLTISGNEAATISAATTGSSLATITVTDTGNVDISALAGGASYADAANSTIKINGGAGVLTADGINVNSTNVQATLQSITETVTAGAGGLDYTFGYAGAGTDGQVVVAGGEDVKLGSETA